MNKDLFYANFNILGWFEGAYKGMTDGFKDRQLRIITYGLLKNFISWMKIIKFMITHLTVLKYQHLSGRN